MQKLLCFGALLLSAVPCAAQLLTSADKVSVVTESGRSYVHAVELGTAIDLEFKVVQTAKLATYCSVGEDAICIPLQLNTDNYLLQAETSYLSIDLVEEALSVTIAVDGKTAVVSVEADGTPTDKASSVAGYNADWPEGRGFRPGNTVPDIPLTVVDGREVRFSEFLGKRYILYCWASW